MNKSIIQGNFQTQKRFVLLDRDGVINRRIPGGYLTSWEQFEFLPRALDALRLLAANNCTTLVLSNQACVGKGLLSTQELHSITRRFLHEVDLAGGHIARVYYCTHCAEDRCACRKPEPGLILRAQRDHHFAPEKAIFVGDSQSDLVAAEAAGCPAIHVAGDDSFVRNAKIHKSQFLAADLFEAAELVLGCGIDLTGEACKAARDSATSVRARSIAHKSQFTDRK